VKSTKITFKNNKGGGVFRLFLLPFFVESAKKVQKLFVYTAENEAFVFKSCKNALK
jgi:hypothetical protein